MPDTLSRDRFIAASLGAFASIAFLRSPTRAAAAQHTFKFGTDTPADHPMNVHGKRIFDEIRSQTGGRVDIQLFPNNQLGGATAMLTQVRSNAMQFQVIDGVTLASVVPVASIQGVGFAFKSSEQAFSAFDGELGARVRKEIEAKGLYAADKMLLNGMRQVTASTKPIANPDDLRGFKIRTPPAKMSLDLFSSLGASPTPMNFNEVYTALQTKVVDGQENPLAVVELSKLYEVQKYLSLTNHMWSGYWLIGNAEAWKSLPPDLQAIVSRNFVRLADLERRDTNKLNTTLLDSLRRHGMTVNTADPAPFRARLGAFYARAKSDFGATAWSMLEKTTGKLA